MPKLVKESIRDDKNCGKKRQQPASSKGKGQKKQKTLAVKTRKSPRKRIQVKEGGARGTEGEQSEISNTESMASRASKSSQSKPTSSSSSKSSSKFKSSSASASRQAVGVPIEEITQDQMQKIAYFYEGHLCSTMLGMRYTKEWTLDMRISYKSKRGLRRRLSLLRSLCRSQYCRQDQVVLEPCLSLFVFEQCHSKSPRCSHSDELKMSEKEERNSLALKSVLHRTSISRTLFKVR